MAAKKKPARKKPAKKKQHSSKKPAGKRVGRPSDFRPEFVELAREQIERGKTDVELAAFFGVAPATLYVWRNNFPIFQEIVQEARRNADEKVEQALLARAIGYSHPETKVFCSEGEIITHEVTRHYPPDPRSMEFWLKNRNRDLWKDESKVEVTGDLAAQIVEARARNAKRSK
jgi:hypothetical protein